jgi:hypothetical protein
MRLMRGENHASRPAASRTLPVQLLVRQQLPDDALFSQGRVAFGDLGGDFLRPRLG